MRNFNFQTGGAPMFHETLLNLETQLRLTQKAFGLDTAKVITGCQITGAESSANMSAGIVFIDGELKEIPARTGLNFTVNPTQYIRSLAGVNQNRNYETGGSKPYYTVFNAEIQNSNTAIAPFTEILEVTFQGVRRRINSNEMQRFAYVRTGNTATLPANCFVSQTLNATLYTTASFVIIEKQGEKIDVRFSLTRNATTTAGDIIITTVDPIFRPLTTQGLNLGNVDNNNTQSMFMAMETDGRFRTAFLSGLSINDTYNGSFSYYIQ